MVLIAELIAAVVLVGRAVGTGPATVPAAGDRTVEVRVLGGVRADDLQARVRAAMDPAVRDVERFWGPDWLRKIVVVLTDSDYRFAFEASLDPRGTWTDIAAVTVADSVDPDQRTATGQRIVLAPGATAMSAEALRIVLTHELFHVAARADTAVDAPRWFVEGVADFVARRPAPIPPDAATDIALPSDAELDSPGLQRSAGYDRAWWFARFVADEFGADGLRRLYRQACGPDHGDFAAAVDEALGLDMAELQIRWGQWLAGSR